MSRLEDLADRIERLVLRHEELKRTNALLAEQLTQTTKELASVTKERNQLSARIARVVEHLDQRLLSLPPDPAPLPTNAQADTGTTANLARDTA